MESGASSHDAEARPAGGVVVVTGLPGAGKTRLALGLAAELAARDVPALVVHTDVEKVTARVLVADAPQGSGYEGDFREKARRLRPVLEAQAEKAVREGYQAVIEGTLALGFTWPAARHLHLEISEEARRRRVARKHTSAADAADGADLAAYAAALEEALPPDAIRLDAEGPAEAIVARAIGLLMGTI